MRVMIDFEGTLIEAQNALALCAVLEDGPDPWMSTETLEALSFLLDQLTMGEQSVPFWRFLVQNHPGNLSVLFSEFDRVRGLCEAEGL